MTQQVLLDLVEALRQRRDERDGGVLAKARNSRAEWTGYPEQTAIEQSWGWTSIKLYESWSIQQTLIDRIARLREEIEKCFGWAIEGYRDIAHDAHDPDHNNRFCRSISSVIALQNRHDKLCNWLWHQNRRNNTIICFSDDPSDLDSHGLGYWDKDINCMAKCAEIVDGTIEHHQYKVDTFEDATLWEYAANCPGSERYYVAFKDKDEAERFRSEINVMLPLWKDVARPARTQQVVETVSPFDMTGDHT